MTLSTYLLYVAAVALLIITPGPTMLMCMTNSINHGPRRAMTSVAGAVTAVLCVMVLSAMGLGALLAASETAFMVAKVAGAAYLIWLGIKTFRSDAVLQVDDQASASPRRSFYLQGVLVGASNPKAVLFFAAFFPQFLNPAASHRAAVRDPGADLRGFRVHGADAVRARRGAPDAAVALQHPGSLDQPDLRRPVHPDGRPAAAHAAQRLIRAAWISRTS